LTQAGWPKDRRYFQFGSLPWSLLAIVLAMYGVYVSFVPRPIKPDPTWSRIQTEGVVRIGIDPSFPPFETDDGNGNLSGFDIALASSLAQKWNVRVQYVYTGFDGLYDALVGKQFDLILSALPYNPQKTQDVFFSHSYFNGGPVLVVRAELGTSGDEVARKWQHRLRLDLQEFNTTRDALLAVEQGQAAAAVVDPISFFDFQRSDSRALRTAGAPLADELYIIAVRKDSPILLDQINAMVDGMKRDGSLNGLQERWF
jgi:polar amino acid transport system substrate-binding protein